MKRFRRGKNNPFTLNFTKENTKGHSVFQFNEEIHLVSGEEYQEISEALSRDTIKDIALKYGLGTASIGLKRYYILAGSLKEAHG